MLAIELRSLSKIYNPQAIALDNINLEVAEGEFLAFLGPNGAGKSTTIGIITSLVKKTSGKVYISGYDLDTHPKLGKSRLGLVPQEFNFNQFEKIFDILVNQAGFYGVPRKVAIDRSEELLHVLNLWDKRWTPARQLSGGMKRRLMLARSLVNEPPILILDEPTTGIDIELRNQTWDFLAGLNRKGTTILLTTHYLSEAQVLCNNVAIINHGKILKRATMRELLSNNEDLESKYLQIIKSNHELSQG